MKEANTITGLVVGASIVALLALIFVVRILVSLWKQQ